MQVQGRSQHRSPGCRMTLKTSCCRLSEQSLGAARSCISRLLSPSREKRSLGVRITFKWYLELVTDVNNNGVAHRGDIDPLVIFEKLQATDLVILEEKDDPTGIGVCPEALDEVWLGTWRVVADLSAKVRTF
nr:putative anion transporter 7 [Ipomoea batatas]